MLNERESQLLNARFPEEIIEEYKGYKYVPVEWVILRLTETFNGNWSYITKITMGHPEMKTNQSGKEYKSTPVYATVELTVVTADGTTIIRAGNGGGIAEFGLHTGDGHKTATSEALKKAAQSLGIGLYLTLDGKEAKRVGNTVKRLTQLNTPPPPNVGPAANNNNNWKPPAKPYKAVQR